MFIHTASARAVAAILTLVLLAAPLASASAQSREDEDAAGAAASAAAAKKKKQVSVPKALPGSHVDSIDPAPLDRPPSEMKPNEALFDGVNRGDIAAVREALARGAELESPNILGQTATEVSIDLARNEITFLLLSMRGAVGRPAGRTPASTAVIASKPAPVAKPIVVAAPKPAAPVIAKPFVSNPGTPAPQAGFLGFGRPTS